MQPKTKSDYIFYLDLQAVDLNESRQILMNLLSITQGSRPRNERLVLKAGRGKKDWLERNIFNTVRSATGAPHTVVVARSDRDITTN